MDGQGKAPVFQSHPKECDRPDPTDIFRAGIWISKRQEHTVKTACCGGSVVWRCFFLLLLFLFSNSGWRKKGVAFLEPPDPHRSPVSVLNTWVALLVASSKESTSLYYRERCVLLSSGTRNIVVTKALLCAPASGWAGGPAIPGSMLGSSPSSPAGCPSCFSWLAWGRFH